METVAVAPEVRAGGSGLWVLSLAAGAFALAQTSVVPGIGVLSSELNASVADIGWVLTGYLILAAILTPVFGRLGDPGAVRRWQRHRRAGSQCVGTGGCSCVAGSRGGIFPLYYGIIGDTFAPRRRPAALGLISALAGIGAGAGLLVGGLLVDHLSWEWIFWSGALMSGLALLGTLTLPESSMRSSARIDLGGFVFAVRITREAGELS